MKTRALTFIALFAVTLSIAAPPAYAGDTAAVAVNTRDDSTVFRLMFNIVRAAGGTVDTSNAAVAASSCTSCETVAIAIQVVLATGSPTVVIPENLAIALNIDCNLCQTLADAYQYVYTTGGQVHFTAEGNQQIADIRRQLEALRNAGLPLDQLQAQVEQLNAQLEQVLLTQMVPAGPPADNQATSNMTTQSSGSPSDSSTTPTDTGTSTTPSDTTTGTQPTPSDTGTATTPSQTGTDTTPTDTGTSTTPASTGTTTSSW
jgi:putative peptide zinc metalloprotease protein